MGGEETAGAPAAGWASPEPGAAEAHPRPGPLGWRRTSLHVILTLLMLLVFLNLGLTLWIVTVLRLSPNGIGPIRVVQGGIELEGQALVADSLVASSLTSRPSQPLHLNSYRNFTLSVRDPRGVLHSRMTLSRDTVRMWGSNLEVMDPGGGILLSASRDRVLVSAEALAVESEAGVRFSSSIQTPSVRAPPANDLMLESPTRSLSLKAPQTIGVESRAGSFTARALKDISFVSMVGSIQLDAANVFVKNLMEAKYSAYPVQEEKLSKYGHKSRKIYQMCACADGKLFLAASDVTCHTAPADDVCR